MPPESLLSPTSSIRSQTQISVTLRSFRIAHRLLGLYLYDHSSAPPLLEQLSILSQFQFPLCSAPRWMAQCIETTPKALDACAFGRWFSIPPFEGSWHILRHQRRQLNLLVPGLATSTTTWFQFILVLSLLERTFLWPSSSFLTSSTIPFAVTTYRSHSTATVSFNS